MVPGKKRDDAVWRDMTLGEALERLAAEKERLFAEHAGGTRTPVSNKVKADTYRRYEQAESAYRALARLLGQLPFISSPEAIREAHRRRRGSGPKAPGPECHEDPCPACGLPVPVEEDVTWTCPADCGREEPGWLPMTAAITEAMREKAGVYSNCGHDFGLRCYPEVPMHDECYGKRFTVVASPAPGSP